MPPPTRDHRDVDAALDGLTPGGNPKGADPKAAAPPPRPERRATLRPRRPTIDPDTYNGRKPFDDLYVADDGSPEPKGGGLEAKVDSLRQKLKAAEAALSRSREAYETRDAELDAVELLLSKERSRAAALAGKLHEIDQVWATRKKELEANVQKALAAKDRQIASLQDAGRKPAAKAETSDRDELEQLAARFQREIAERDVLISGFRQELRAQEGEAERMKMALRAERAKIAKLQGS